MATGTQRVPGARRVPSGYRVPNFVENSLQVNTLGITEEIRVPDGYRDPESPRGQESSQWLQSSKQRDTV